MESFLNRVEVLSEKYGIDFVISLSMDTASAADYMKKYIK